ncbi:MAG: hypothetical protein U9O20_00395 [Patescibacteria group bacterium]|nr:hypothetical protein [Patescibacteria group bacterium]
MMVVVVYLVISGAVCWAGEYQFQAGDKFPQFHLTPVGLSIWGSAIDNATGFNNLTVLEEDVPYETIKAWYGTMLVARIADRVVRIIYDDSSGKITKVIPW